MVIGQMNPRPAGCAVIWQPQRKLYPFLIFSLPDFQAFQK